MLDRPPAKADLIFLVIFVIATPDAVLILPRGDSQQVKRAVEALKKDGHRTLNRPFRALED